jgi:hypothetical protein
MTAFLILSAHWASASDFTLPELKYDQRAQGSLPSAPASGQKLDLSAFKLPAVSKQKIQTKGITQDGLVSPPNGIDFKIRVVKGPTLDQGIIKIPDSKR